MIPFNYMISSNQMGRGRISKVYKIKKINPPHNILIAKIYDQSRINQYENEKNILSQISDLNDYLIRINNEEVILEHIDDFGVNPRILAFDYLAHGKLIDYMEQFPNLNALKENHVKLLCYKLLLGLKKCQEKNISHNKIEIKNIMFDKEFNPVIIHFSEASINTNKNFNKDFYGLGIVLAKLITSGRFKTISFDNKTNKYYIRINNANLNPMQKIYFEEMEFWKYLDLLYRIKISEKFINFFDILMKAKKALNINDLLNHEWFLEMEDNLNKLEIEFRKTIKIIYDTILDSQKIVRYPIDISKILHIKNQKKELSIISELIDNKKQEKDEGINLSNFNQKKEKKLENKKYS